MTETITAQLDLVNAKAHATAAATARATMLRERRDKRGRWVQGVPQGAVTKIQAAKAASMLAKKQHNRRRAAGDTWTVDAQGAIVHGAHPENAALSGRAGPRLSEVAPGLLGNRKTWTVDSAGAIVKGAHPVSPPGRWEFIRSGNRTVVGKPQVGDKARLSLGAAGNQVGTVVNVVGLVAAIDSGDDGMRYVVDWRNGQVKSKVPLSELPGGVAAAGLGPKSPPLSMPAQLRPSMAGQGPRAKKEARARQLRAQGYEPESIRGIMENETFGTRRKPPPAPSPPGVMVAPGVKQYLLPGMPVPETQTGHDSAPVRELREITVPDLAKGSVNSPSQGIQGDVSIVTLPGGKKVVHKIYHSGYENMADADELAYYVSETVGAGSPPVARPSGGKPGEIVEGLVPGTVAGVSGVDEEELEESPQGEKIGLLDYLIANPDRHNFNWMVTPDGDPVPIDNSSGFDVAGWGVTGTDSDFWQDAPLSQAEYDRLTSELTALQPEFARLDHMAWYRAMMSRLKGIAPDAEFTTISGQAAGLTGIGAQLELAGGWRDAWRTELRGPHGEWVRGGGAITGQLQAHGTASAAARTGPADTPAPGSYRARLAADGLPTPSPESLATARTMVQSAGITAAQHEAVARVLGDNLDLIPPQMRDAMAKTHKVRVLPQKDMGNSHLLGETGAFSGSWEIRISKVALTAEEDHNVAELENAGQFIKTEGPASFDPHDDTKYLALRHTVTHEFGHGLFELSMIEAGKVYTVPGDPEALATFGEEVAEQKIARKIVEDLGGPSGGPAGMKRHPAQFEKAIHALSRYGSTSPPEAMAEAYTAYALSGKGADGSTLARTAGQDFLRAAEQEFASTDAGKGMTVNLSAADRPYTGCSGLPATTEDFERMYGTPEAKAAAARAWGLPAPAPAAGGISGQALGLADGITAQVLEFVWEGWRTEPRDSHGRWTRGPGVLTGITAQAAAPARVPANQLRLPGMPRRAALHAVAPGILTGDPQALHDRIQRVTAARQRALTAAQAPAHVADIGRAVAESKIYTATEMQRMQAQLTQLQKQLETENLQHRRAAAAVKIGIGVAGVVFSAMTAGLGVPIVAALAASSLAPVAAELADYHVGEKGRFSWLQHPVTKARTLLGHPVAKKTLPEPVPVAPPPKPRRPRRRSSPPRSPPAG